MVSENLCGMPTRTGEPCQWTWDTCPVGTHRTQRRRQGLRIPPKLPVRDDRPTTPGPRPRRAPAAQLALPESHPAEAVPTECPPEDEKPPLLSPPAEDHDVRGTLWWVLRSLFSGELQPPQASAANSLLRTLAGLGDEPLSESDALRAVELRARIMLGLPPTPGDWQALEAMVDADTLAELRRWPATPA